MQLLHFVVIPCVYHLCFLSCEMYEERDKHSIFNGKNVQKDSSLTSSWGETEDLGSWRRPGSMQSETQRQDRVRSWLWPRCTPGAGAWSLGDERRLLSSTGSGRLPEGHLSMVPTPRQRGHRQPQGL